MNATPIKSAVYTGVIPSAAFAPAKLAELQLSAKRLAVFAAKGRLKARLRQELAQYFSTPDELERMVSNQMPSDNQIISEYDLAELAREYRLLPYHMTFHQDGNVYVTRSPYFSFAPASGELFSPTPGSRPCYSVPAAWLLKWNKPLFNVPSISAPNGPTYAWKPAYGRKDVSHV